MSTRTAETKTAKKAKKAKKANKVYVTVSTVGASEVGPAGDSALKERVLALLGAEEVDRKMVEERFDEYIDLAGGFLTKASKVATGFAVDSITFHLAVDAKFGLAFVGGVGVEGAIDVVLKRG